jgi:ParB family chromosome partitioning protein
MGDGFNEETYEKLTVESIEIDKIRPNPYQPRVTFDTAALKELTASIAEHGVLQPITVRRLAGGYELVAGERRLRASQQAGFTTIPAIITNVSDEKSSILAMIENIQRQDLNYFEEAQGYQNLAEDYHLKQEEIAQMMGKSQSTVANKLRLLKIPVSMRRALIENDLSERHARALLKLPNDEAREKLLKRVIKESLTVKKTEDLVEAVLKGAEEGETDPQEEAKKQRIKRYIKDIRLFTNTVRKAADYMKEAGVPVEVTEDKTTEYYEMVIRVPLS